MNQFFEFNQKLLNILTSSTMDWVNFVPLNAILSHRNHFLCVVFVYFWNLLVWTWTLHDLMLLQLDWVSTTSVPHKKGVLMRSGNVHCSKWEKKTRRPMKITLLSVFKLTPELHERETFRQIRCLYKYCLWSSYKNTLIQFIHFLLASFTSVQDSTSIESTTLVENSTPLENPSPIEGTMLVADPTFHSTQLFTFYLMSFFIDFCQKLQALLLIVAHFSRFSTGLLIHLMDHLDIQGTSWPFK